MKRLKKLKPLFLFFLFLSPVFFFPAVNAKIITGAGEELISRNDNRCSILTYERPAGSFDEQPPPNITVGEQRTIILMAHTPDKQPPAEATREAVVYEGFFNPDYSLNAFFEESSLNQDGDRQIWFTGDVFGWYVLPYNSDHYGKYGFESLEKDTMEAADKEVDFSQYTRMIFVFWEQLGASAGSIQMRRFETDDGVCWLTSSFLNYKNFFHLSSPGTKQHEMGHNLGWWHGGGALLPDDRCSCEVGELKPSSIYKEVCEVYTYADAKDIMGSSSRFTQPSGWRKRKAGWLKPEQCLEVRENRTFWLDQRALPSDGIKLAEIPAAPCVSGGSPASFTLELFSSLGKIDSLPWQGKDKFLIVRYHTGDRCIIPDYNDSVMFYAAGFPVFFDRDSYCNQEFGFEIKFLGYSGEGVGLKAQVEVNFWCPEKIAPDVSARIEPQKIYTGDDFDCFVSLTNNCQIGCGTQTYSLSLEMSPQMQAGELAPVELAPYSATEEVNIKINTSPSIPPGIYKVVVTAADTDTGDIVGTGEASITIADLKCASAKLRKLKVKPKRVVVKKLESKEVTVTAIGTGGCPMEGQDIGGRVLIGREKIQVSPLMTSTDENGRAFFTIIAYEIGTATVQFETFWGEFPVKVRVRVK